LQLKVKFLNDICELFCSSLYPYTVACRLLLCLHKALAGLGDLCLFTQFSVRSVFVFAAPFAVSKKLCWRLNIIVKSIG